MPVRPQGAPLLNSFVVVGLLAAIVGLAAAFIADLVQRGKERNSSSYREFRSMWAQTRAEIARPFRRKA